MLQRLTAEGFDRQDAAKAELCILYDNDWRYEGNSRRLDFWRFRPDEKTLTRIIAGKALQVVPKVARVVKGRYVPIERNYEATEGQERVFPKSEEMVQQLNTNAMEIMNLRIVIADLEKARQKLIEEVKYLNARLMTGEK